MARTFADLVNEAMAKKFKPDGDPWSDYTLSSAIGLLPGDKSFDAKQVWRLRRGERRQLTPELVERIIEALGQGEPWATEEWKDEAWALAGLLPPGAEAADVAELRDRIAQRRRRSDREVEQSETAAEATVRARSVRNGVLREPTMLASRAVA
jgi:ABC-type nitrate/sulfonate/bicarbonate transport system substrate-binding protein